MIKEIGQKTMVIKLLHPLLFMTEQECTRLVNVVNEAVMCGYPVILGNERSILCGVKIGSKTIDMAIRGGIENGVELVSNLCDGCFGDILQE